MSQKIIIIIFFLFLATTGMCQQWKIWSTSNSNIPTNELKCLIIDITGTLWIGSDAGLIRFDGNSFTVFDTSNTPMKSNSVWGIDNDRQNNLWISTIKTTGQTSSALMKFDRVNVWSSYNTQNSGISNNNTWCVKIDTNNIIWSSFYKLNKFNGSTWYIYDSTNSPLIYSSIREIFVDKQNNKWMGNDYFGMYKFTNDTSWTIYTPNNSGILGALTPKIRQDNFGNMWFSADGGLCKFDPVNNLWNNWTPQNSNIFSGRPWGICITRNNTKWFGYGSDGPLTEFNDTTFTHYFFPFSQQPIIWDIKEDKYGNLWMATKSGLMEFNKNGIVGINNYSTILPTNFKINKIYPNPFNPTTNINFTISKSVKVSVKIFNLNGKEIQTLIDKNYLPGNYELSWDANNISTGIYFILFYLDNIISTSRKTILIK